MQPTPFAMKHNPSWVSERPYCALTTRSHQLTRTAEVRSMTHFIEVEVEVVNAYHSI